MSFFGHWLMGKVGRHIRNRITAGLLLLVPLAITYLILRFLFDYIDELLQPAIRQGLGRTIPGAGVAALLIVIYLLGLLGTTILLSPIIRFGEWVLMRTPLVRTVYGTSKQLMLLFSGTSTSGFKRVVAVEFPRSGVWSIAFLTGITSDEQGRPLAVVYIPTAPLPSSGYVNLIPADQVYDLNVSVQAAMSLVLSGGIISPEQFHKTPLRLSEDGPPAPDRPAK